MKSYDLHIAHERSLVGIASYPSCFSRPTSVDAWRHRRMLESVLPLIKHFPAARWITVGDGNFGSDAAFLQGHRVDVTATSISTETLSVAHERGWIEKYAAENAESLSFADGSVDFVLCKEALHHLPRPAIGIYEMLRVAKEAVVLIEPIEGSTKPLMVLKYLVKRALRGMVTDEYEACGNFLYRVTIREVQKMMAGVGLRFVAYRGINDFYHPASAAAPASPGSIGFTVTRLAIGFQNLMARTRLLNYGLSAIVCFKTRLEPALRAELERAGFHILEVAPNPYV